MELQRILRAMSKNYLSADVQYTNALALDLVQFLKFLRSFLLYATSVFSLAEQFPHNLQRAVVHPAPTTHLIRVYPKIITLFDGTALKLWNLLYLFIKFSNVRYWNNFFCAFILGWRIIIKLRNENCGIYSDLSSATI